MTDIPMPEESTFIMVKPDGVQRGLVGEVLRRFEHSGLEILRMKMTIATEERIRSHYQHVADSYGPRVLEQIVEWMKNYCVVVAELNGRNAVAIARRIAGATDPINALPGTLRGDFCTDSIRLSSAEDRAVQNLVHTAETADDALREMSIWL